MLIHLSHGSIDNISHLRKSLIAILTSVGSVVFEAELLKVHGD